MTALNWGLLLERLCEILTDRAVIAASMDLAKASICFGILLRVVVR